MFSDLNLCLTMLLAADIPAWFDTTIGVIKVVIGFSVIIFVHELGHFLAAKWVGIRVDRFSVGFLYRICGWRKGEGFTFGKSPDYTAEQLEENGYGETDYCFKILPFGGYVKMLGQDDIQINEETGEVKMSDDPRSFPNKSVSKRMLVVSSGVLFNIIFAIIAFMAVFMMGKSAVEPRIGMVEPGSPAAAADLRQGDLILEANGDPIHTFRDLLLAQILTEDGLVHMKVERDGQKLPDDLVMNIEGLKGPPQNISGIIPYRTTELADEPDMLRVLPGVRGGDRITHVDGLKVTSATDFVFVVNRQVEAAGRPRVELTIERPDRADSDHATTLTLPLEVNFEIGPTVVQGPKEVIVDSGHILGFCPRRMAKMVIPGDPGERAGLQPGDIFVQWDAVLNPLFSEIVENINANPGQPIPIVVERDGETRQLTLTPKQPFSVIGTAKPRVGVEYGLDDERAIVAEVAPDTPAANLNMPRGSQILSIDGVAVSNWFDVSRQLKASAGKDITIRYSSGNAEFEARMTVPSSIVNELELPLLARVMSINGESSVELESGLTVRLPNALALQALLKKNAGESVTVKYRLDPEDSEIQTARFTVAADGSNADPWQMRLGYSLSPLPFMISQKIIQTNNPFTAAYMGITNTGNILKEVFQVIKSIAKSFVEGRTGTAEHVAGPVGIVGAAIDQAKRGFPELLFFLAFLSVNLAVINFLPFPVVDGGLMVFLLIEKLKGKPLSIKTQMVATLVGLATIVLVFLLVTIKDIGRIWGG